MTNRPGVVVVGPGKAFGAELCEEIQKSERVPLLLSRTRPGYAGAGTRWWQVDLLRSDGEIGPVAADLARRFRIEGVIYNAVHKSETIPTKERPAPHTLDQVTIPDLMTHARVAALGLVTYRNFKKALMQTGGSFVVTGGNFAFDPDPDHAGLSMAKAVSHTIVEMQRRVVEAQPVGDPNPVVPMKEFIIDGEAPPQATVIAKALVNLAVPIQ